MACHATKCGQNAFGSSHTLNILGTGFFTSKYNLCAALMRCLSFIGGEINHTTCCSGACCKTRCLYLCSFERSLFKRRMQQRIKALGVYHRYSFFLSACTFFYEVNRNLQCCGCGALTVAGLEHIEMSALDGKFHILHITIMLFKDIRNSDKFIINFLISDAEMLN